MRYIALIKLSGCGCATLDTLSILVFLFYETERVPYYSGCVYFVKYC